MTRKWSRKRGSKGFRLSTGPPNRPMNLSGRGGHIRVYNTGSWVVPPDRRHPACHLFAVDDEGAEYLLDIAFDEGVKVGDQTLLDLASKDVENRLKSASGLTRGARKALDWLS